MTYYYSSPAGAARLESLANGDGGRGGQSARNGKERESEEKEEEEEDSLRFVPDRHGRPMWVGVESAAERASFLLGAGLCDCYATELLAWWRGQEGSKKWTT